MDEVCKTLNDLPASSISTLFGPSATDIQMKLAKRYCKHTSPLDRGVQLNIIITCVPNVFLIFDQECNPRRIQPRSMCEGRECSINKPRRGA